MNCKRCGKEIVGEIQRYCNECKREVRGEEPVKTLEKEAYRETISKKEEKMVCEEIVSPPAKEEEVSQKKEKKHRIFSLGYILLVIFIIALTFLASCVVGFAIGPVLPI
nr:hypothetical protein [uncultured Cellulosilyticum sp.]